MDIGANKGVVRYAILHRLSDLVWGTRPKLSTVCEKFGRTKACYVATHTPSNQYRINLATHTAKSETVNCSSS